MDLPGSAQCGVAGQAHLLILGQRYAPDGALATFDAHLAVVFRPAAGRNHSEKPPPPS